MFANGATRAVYGFADPGGRSASSDPAFFEADKSRWSMYELPKYSNISAALAGKSVNGWVVQGVSRPARTGWAVTMRKGSVEVVLTRAIENPEGKMKYPAFSALVINDLLGALDSMAACAEAAVQAWVYYVRVFEFEDESES